MLRRCAAALTPTVSGPRTAGGSSRMGTSPQDTLRGKGRTQQFGNASGFGRKVNPTGRPQQEYEKQHSKRIMRPAAVIRLVKDFDSAAFLKPRLDLSRRPPPTEAEAVQLYRALLKKGERTLVWTDKGWFRRAVRFEFTVTSRLAAEKLDLQRCMFEKGEWLLNNDLGGLR
eukprot:TRINITY_DN11708_c0_g1_i1.p2 TRINITY_DN11708_c0_g1~~TRINITY_DN11708_c0_g1_i1.p2  ORF type:complete len:171 (+),score=54.47 TRINITY_DN11708_c0_g1_i1:66-578(+)